MATGTTGGTGGQGSVQDVTGRTPQGGFIMSNGQVAGGGVLPTGGTNQNGGSAPGSGLSLSGLGNGIMTGAAASSQGGTNPLLAGGMLIAGGALLFGLIGFIPFIAIAACLIGAQAVEDWFRGVDADGNPVPSSPFAPGKPLASLASGFLGDIVLVAGAAGVVYLVMRRPGGQVVVIEGGKARTNPPGRRRPLRRVRAL